MKKPISIRLCEETLSRLESLGSQYGIGRTETIERLIAEAFARREGAIGVAYPKGIPADEIIFRERVRPNFKPPPYMMRRSK